MAEEKNNKPSETALPTGFGDSGIDFGSISALSNSEYTVEPWAKRFFGGLGEGAVKLLLFLFGFLLDILKSLWAVFSGIFITIYRLCKGVYLFFRKEARIFKELDGYGKGSFLLQGLGLIKHGQVVNGIIFMIVEIAFIVYMAAMGGAAIGNLFRLGKASRKLDGGSHVWLILGIMAIIVIVAYIVVYIKGIQATYDNYQIEHELDFRAARENALRVLEHNAEYEEDLSKLNHFQVFRLMRDKYGYNELSARYISYVDFKRVPEKGPNPILRAIDGCKNGIHNVYLKWANKVRAGRWSSVFADFLNWELIKRKPTTGIEVVKNEVEIDLIRFRHTYDKYNNYHQVVRDSEAMLKCFRDPENLLKAIYADDEVSKRNSIAPVDHRVAVKAKVALSRIVGFFEVSLPVGIAVSNIVARIVKEIPDDAGRLEAFRKECEKEELELKEFIEKNRDGAKLCAAGYAEALRQYPENASFFDQGIKAFVPHVMAIYHLDQYHAEDLYRMYARARANNADEEGIVLFLAQAAKRHDGLKDLMDNYAFHGQVLNFKKQAKQYLDEKFAVTVLALPTLGALLTTIIPLIFSIAIAFTGWDGTVKNYVFDWSMAAWENVFGLGSKGDAFILTFGTLLRWTIIWAFLATFSNYIMGIVLALMINKKGIKLKALWRTCFVVTIAIPQFITLLVIQLLFSADGAVNTWLQNTFGWKIPFLSEIVNGNQLFALDSNYVFIKFFIVVINMWIGIPYTMLSTSGILMNIPADLYESAQIDGANSWTQFWKITMPYIIFVTGPSLLTTFIGNINNFNVIYFLTKGEPRGIGDSLSAKMSMMGAGHTDLLITWLYKITANKTTGAEYSMGSVIGVLMFAVCAFFSLIMYRRMGSVKNEEAFQ